ncbi:MAG: [FeFe] hydrogenase H-cluster maturation GTPase HydF [Proteobacteria bacterium]|nr:[FeFe] hydrogenase H-cluster maturation GTPase HydF [Pseudomonadota bacterium]
MQGTPKSLRLQIGIFGRRNVGKSSILNGLVKQSVSIVSSELGTTTDPVEKPMELLPLGPVLFIDTAGLDDEGSLGSLRVEKTRAIFDRCDFALLVTDGIWEENERQIAETLTVKKIPWLAVLNKADLADYATLQETLQAEGIEAVRVNANKAETLEDLQQAIIRKAPASFLEGYTIIGDLLPPDAHVLLVIPIDKQAPKGRIILPQVQTLRDILDHRMTCSVCQEDQVAQMLCALKAPPNLIVTDSQAFGAVSLQTPSHLPLTSFSILFARFKGDLNTMVLGLSGIRRLRPNDRILIAEACTHHPAQDDIGREKIPRWLREHIHGDLHVDVVSGQHFPQDLSPYKVIIQCGACVLTRRQVLSRIQKAAAAGIPITNYGLVIAHVHGILDRALIPFPDALTHYLND